jgi:hypothetical protein
MKFQLALLSALSLSSLAQAADLSGLHLDLKSYQQFVESNAYDKSSCGAQIDKMSSRLRSINWSDYTNSEIKNESKQLTQDLWELKLALHQKLDQVDGLCNAKLRSLFSTMRNQDDYLSEFSYQGSNLDPAKIDFEKQAVPIYDRGAYAPYYIRKDVDTDKFQFQAGDLMVAKGVSFFSAILSESTVEESHYSHLVFVNTNEKTGVPNTVESYVAVGVSAYEINFALKNENARLLVLRPKDKNLGRAAADKAMLAVKNKVPYDYKLNMADHSAMNCLEVGIYAYQAASNNQINVPEYPAHLNIINKALKNSMSIVNGPFPAPDDLETDSRFELLLDWKDVRVLRNSRQKDAILAGILRWMNTENYNFHNTPKAWLAADILLPSRETMLWPLLKKLTGSPDLDPRMPRSMLGIMMDLNEVGLNILKELSKRDDQFSNKYGRPMTNEQLRAEVEKIRADDFDNYVRGRANIFHNILRPDGVYPKSPTGYQP